jgi:hypothetical protein
MGTIRLRATATFPAAAAGRHKVLYRNTHQSKISVYLANALVFLRTNMSRSGQRRDSAQHELAIDYRVVQASSLAPVWWIMLGLAVAGVCVSLGKLAIRLHISSEEVGAVKRTRLQPKGSPKDL